MLARKADHAVRRVAIPRAQTDFTAYVM